MSSPWRRRWVLQWNIPLGTRSPFVHSYGEIVMNNEGKPNLWTASMRNRFWCCQKILEKDSFSRLRFGEQPEALEALMAPVIILKSQRSHWYWRMSKLDGEIYDWGQDFMHVGDFATCTIVLSIKNTFTEGGTEVESAFHSAVAGCRIDLIQGRSSLSTQLHHNELGIRRVRTMQQVIVCIQQAIALIFI